MVVAAFLSMDQALASVRAYHKRSKHQLQRYAQGPDTLDWDAQPKAFRHWASAPLTKLPVVADRLATPWADLSQPERIETTAPSIEALGALFELSFGLTAWKSFGPDRWAVRANPSSGNLHPTEAYLFTSAVPCLPDGLYHYAPREHALEQRMEMQSTRAPQAQMWIGLSSIHWREAWKYGERAFRYCQLDLGHALGALRYACAVLGWRAHIVDQLRHEELASRMGLDRAQDFGLAEREEAELLISIGPHARAAQLPPTPATCSWHGTAERLDAKPMYQWPIIEEVAQCTRNDQSGHMPALTSSGRAGGTSTPISAAALAATPAAGLIRQRRSAQHFDRRATMPREVFLRLAAAVLPGTPLPWDIWPDKPRIHAVFFVHRVDGLAPGAYLLARSDRSLPVLQQALQLDSATPIVEDKALDVQLYVLAQSPKLVGTLRTLSCHQAIGSDACFALSMLGEFEAALAQGAHQYRALFQEAGLLGQVLYMQAEAEGYRGTGIGCYFDDAVHELLGLSGERLQVLYQFTVGIPMLDTRISTEAPYV